MRTRSGNYIIGTSAIDMRNGDSRPCRIMRLEYPAHQNRTRVHDLQNPIARFVRRACEGSEMLCSLMFEDLRGCAYGIFSRRETVIASVVVTALAVLAIALGA